MIETVNKICAQLPERWVISLCMENGAAWVEMTYKERSCKLPDPTDKTIIEQLNDALCVATGWEKP